MNKELRKAIYNTQMLRNKYEKYHTDKTWEVYRKQQSLVTMLKKNQSEHIFREVYSQAIIVKRIRQVVSKKCF
jgi:hypothetical protein